MTAPAASPPARLSNASIAGLLLVLTLVAYLLVIANPGFYSHDEWQKVDFIREHGMAAFANAFGKVVAGPEFGYPVRPLGFLQQGFSAAWMTRAPLVPHLLDVLLHAVTVLVLWGVLRAAQVRGRAAIVAALVFALSPLATVSTAWVAASFDRWYVLFFLVAVFGWIRAIGGARASGHLLVLLGSSGAILSKETAMVLPGALLLAGWALRQRGLPWPGPARLATLLACASVPILAYLAIRWPALQATLGGHGGPYSPSPARMPGNALLYFAYPFTPAGVETLTLSLLPRWQFALGLLAHAALVVALWRRGGVQWVALYVAGYFVFLVPVLVLPMSGAHYLYGAGLAFALAWAAVLTPRAEPQPDRHAQAWAWGLVAVLAILSARSLWIQQAFYSEGRCQSEFLASFDTLAEAAVAGDARRLVLSAAPGARDYVAVKATFGRPQYSAGGRWPMVRAPAPPLPGDANLEMLPDCRVAWRSGQAPR